MNPVVWNTILTELALSLNYVVLIFLLQISLFFVKKWYDDKRRQISNYIILAYALYFCFLTVGIGIESHFIGLGGNPFELYGNYMLVSVIFRGISGVLFVFILELKLLKHSKFLISISFLILVGIVTILMFSPIRAQAVASINLIILLLPFIFLIYLLRKTYGEVRQKLTMGLLGFLLIGGSLAFSTYFFDQTLQKLFIYSGFVIFPFKLLAILGALLIIYGFRGYSFFLEAEWQQNFIALFIIDKTRKTELFHQTFLEGEITEEGVFAGGMAGLMTIIDDFATSKKELKIEKEIDTVNLGKNFIKLTSGEMIISALLVKKDIQHAKFFLKMITSKFESYYSDILKSPEVYGEILARREIFKPMEMFIRDIIKL